MGEGEGGWWLWLIVIYVEFYSRIIKCLKMSTICMSVSIYHPTWNKYFIDKITEAEVVAHSAV